MIDSRDKQVISLTVRCRGCGYKIYPGRQGRAGRGPGFMGKAAGKQAGGVPVDKAQHCRLKEVSGGRSEVGFHGEALRPAAGGA